MNDEEKKMTRRPLLEGLHEAVLIEAKILLKITDLTNVIFASLSYCVRNKMFIFVGTIIDVEII